MSSVDGGINLNVMTVNSLPMCHVAKEYDHVIKCASFFFQLRCAVKSFGHLKNERGSHRHHASYVAARAMVPGSLRIYITKHNPTSPMPFLHDRPRASLILTLHSNDGVLGAVPLPSTPHPSVP